MRGALLIFKKELMEFSRDKRTMFFTLLMPLILYTVMFSIMAKLGRRNDEELKNHPSRVALVDPDKILTPLLTGPGSKFEIVAPPQGDLSKAILAQKLELQVVVGPDAALRRGRQEPVTLTVTRDPSERASALAYDRLEELLKASDARIVAARLASLHAPAALVEPTRLVPVNAGDQGRAVTKVLGAFLPYLVMMMMLQGATQHGVYATAGEKERGTLLGLLSTALPRRQIIWGKLLYIFTMGVVAALVNILSVALSYVLWAQPAAKSGNTSALANPLVLVLAFVLMVPLGLLFSNLILLVGVWSKNSAEAGTGLAPLTFFVLIVGVFMMSPGVDKMSLLPYLPVVNVSLAIRKLFSQQSNTFEYLLAMTMTFGIAAYLTWTSTRLLNREEALFRA
jgi:sodium transport system permease protein